MSSKSFMTKSEQDRQTVMKRAEKLNTDYAKEMDAFEKDLKARLEAAEQRKMAAIKQKVPMAHYCPASGECEECAEKQRKLKAAMKAMQKAAPKKTAFKKKTLNRQLSRSADDVSMVLTQKRTTKATSEVGANSQKDSIMHKTVKSAKFTMNAAMDSAALVTATIGGFLGFSSSDKKEAPAVPPAGTAKEAITDDSPTSSTTSSPESIRYGDGYVRDTAANFVKISEAQQPKSNTKTVKLTMTQVAGASKSANTVVTSKGTVKNIVKSSQREQQKVRMVTK